MKMHHLFPLAMLACTLCTPAWSEPADTTPAPAPAAPETPKAVPASLAKLKFLHGTPDLTAKHYLYLQSASWCGPCQQHMPIIVAAYPEMKKLGFEFILLSQDSVEKGAMEMVEAHNIPFPVAMAAEAGARNLPGYAEARGIPIASWVSPEGEVRLETHPYYLFPKGQWRAILASYEAPRTSVKEALPHITFLQGAPDPEAKYYAYLECANTCAPCHQAMPRVVQAYEELRQAGVEVIMCCRDNERTTRHYAERYGVPFPVLADGNAAKLPGFRNSLGFGIPHVIVVRADGSPLWEGHPIRFFVDQEWKKHLGN